MQVGSEGFRAVPVGGSYMYPGAVTVAGLVFYPMKS